MYWNNQPSPYHVERLNAIQGLDGVEVLGVFSRLRDEDRSWEVHPQAWDFKSTVLPDTGWRKRSATLRRVVATYRPDVSVTLYGEPEFALHIPVLRLYSRRLVLRVLPTYSAWERRTIPRTLAKRALFRFADGCKVPGPDGANYAIRYGFPPRRVHRVTQSIPVAHFSSPTRRPQGRTCRFVFVGRVWRGKGIFELLLAAETLRNERFPFELTIVGDGADFAKAQGFCHERNLDVRFTGFVPRSELPEILAAQDVLVFPTHGDPNGLVVEEAMAAGCCVIASDSAGDIRQRVEDPACGIVVPTADSHALAQSMARLARSPVLRSKMAERAMRQARLFEHQVYALDFRKMLEAVLANPKRWSSYLHGDQH